MTAKILRRIFGEKCYNTAEKKCYYLYKNEITAEYIKANIVGSAIGLVWIKASELKPNDSYYHDKLDDDQIKYIKEIRSNLQGVYDQSQEEWENGFRKDRDINKEIASWWFLSSRFSAIRQSMILDAEEVKSLFNMMLQIMNNGSNHAENGVRYAGQIEKHKYRLINDFIKPESAQQADAPEPLTRPGDP